MVSTHLKNIPQIRSFPQVGVKLKDIWIHHLENNFPTFINFPPGMDHPALRDASEPWVNPVLPDVGYGMDRSISDNTPTEKKTRFFTQARWDMGFPAKKTTDIEVAPSFLGSMLALEKEGSQ